MPTKDPRWAHYVQSALVGSKHGVECIVHSLGSDRVLFGTDTPFDTKDGSHFMQVTISDIEAPARRSSAGSDLQGQCPQILGIQA
jgi:predicted TIM-barrel fold metal-dependent hydrolase